MPTHAHPCAHAELVHCLICDRVYCPACGREWGTIQAWVSPFHFYVPGYLGPLYSVTVGGTSVSTGSTATGTGSAHNHAVDESLDKSIQDNSAVWQELAKQ